MEAKVTFELHRGKDLIGLAIDNTSDCVCKITIGNTTETSDKIEGTTNPMFTRKKLIFPKVPIPTVAKVEMFHEDTFMGIEFIGSTTISLLQPSQTVNRETAMLTHGSNTKLMNNPKARKGCGSLELSYTVEPIGPAGAAGAANPMRSSADGPIRANQSPTTKGLPEPLGVRNSTDGLRSSGGLPGLSGGGITGAGVNTSQNRLPTGGTAGSTPQSSMSLPQGALTGTPTPGGGAPNPSVSSPITGPSQGSTDPLRQSGGSPGASGVGARSSVRDDAMAAMRRSRELLNMKPSEPLQSAPGTTGSAANASQSFAPFGFAGTTTAASASIDSVRMFEGEPGQSRSLAPQGTHAQTTAPTACVIPSAPYGFSGAPSTINQSQDSAPAAAPQQSSFFTAFTTLPQTKQEDPKEKEKEKEQDAKKAQKKVTVSGTARQQRHGSPPVRSSSAGKQRTQKKELPLQTKPENQPLSTGSKTVTQGAATAAVFSDHQALFTAAMQGNTKLFAEVRRVDMMLSQGFQDVRDYSGRTLLHIAAWHGQIGVLHELLHPINNTHPPIQFAKLVSENGNTILHSAAEGGRPDVVQWLIQQRGVHECAIVTNARNQRPVEAAASRGHEAAANVLARFNTNALRPVIQ